MAFMLNYARLFTYNAILNYVPILNSTKMLKMWIAIILNYKLE